MAPGEGGRQRLLTGDRCPAPSAEQRERVAKAGGDLLRREHRDTCRGELQRQRHAVEAVADLRHRSGVVVVEGESGSSRGSTQDEQLQRGDTCHCRCRPDVLRIGHGQRGCQPADLTRNAQRLTAGRQDGDLRTALQQLGDRPSTRVDQVFTVVEHDEEVSVAQLRHQRVDWSLTSSQPKSQRLCHLLHDQVAVGQRRQLDEKDAVAIARHVLARELDRERGLAGARRDR